MSAQVSDALADDLRNRLIHDGWAQGSVIKLESVVNDLESTVPGDADLVVIATHTCDLLHPQYSMEPDVELLPASWLATATPNDVGKSFRTFSLEAEGERQGHFQIIQRKPLLIARRSLFESGLLCERQPSARIRRSFAVWLGDRYARPPYPDAFRELLGRKATGKIQKLCGDLKGCTGLFMTLSSWEELPNGPYRVAVILMMRGDATTRDMAAAESAHGQIQELFRTKGIEVSRMDPGVRSEKAVTVDDYRSLTKWHLDYLTTRDSSGEHATPPPRV